MVIFLLSTALKTRFRLLVSFTQPGEKAAPSEPYDYCFSMADEHVFLDPKDNRKVLRTNIKHEVLLQVKIPGATDLSEMECEVLRVVHTDRRGDPQERDTRKAINGDRSIYDERSVTACYKCFKGSEGGATMMLCSNNNGRDHHACSLVCHASCDGLETEPAEDWYCYNCRIQPRRLGGD